MPDQQVIALVLYDGEPLEGMGTVLDAVEYTLEVGDVLRIQSSEDGAETYQVLVNGIEVMEEVVLDDDLNTDNPCVGFVRVAEVEEIDVPEPGSEDEPDVIILATADVARNSGNTGTTLTADPTLRVTMGANEHWHIDFYMYIEGEGVNTGFKWRVDGPAGATGYYTDTPWNEDTFPIGTGAPTTATDTGTYLWHIYADIINGANAGFADIMWAQSVSHADDIIRKAHSSVVAFKVP